MKLLRENALQTRWLNGFSATDKEWSLFKESERIGLSMNSHFIVWIGEKKKKKNLPSRWTDGTDKQWTEIQYSLVWILFSLAGSKSIHMVVRVYCLHYHCPLSFEGRSNYAGIKICLSYFIWYVLSDFCYVFVVKSNVKRMWRNRRGKKRLTCWASWIVKYMCVPWTI